jgi:hypothetical protein
VPNSELIVVYAPPDQEFAQVLVRRLDQHDVGATIASHKLGNPEADFEVLEAIVRRRASLLLVLSSEASQYLQSLWDERIQRRVSINTASPVFVAVIADSDELATTKLFDQFEMIFKEDPQGFNTHPVDFVPVWFGTREGRGWSEEGFDELLRHLAGAFRPVAASAARKSQSYRLVSVRLFAVPLFAVFAVAVLLNASVARSVGILAESLGAGVRTGISFAQPSANVLIKTGFGLLAAAFALAVVLLTLHIAISLVILNRLKTDLPGQQLPPPTRATV